MNPNKISQEVLNKIWDDCSIEEKIEKVREELLMQRHLSSRVNDLNRNVMSLMKHDHVNGKVVKEIVNEVAHNVHGLAGAGRIDPLA